MSYKHDFMRRHAEALRDKRPMQPPLIRTLMRHEQAVVTIQSGDTA